MEEIVQQFREELQELLDKYKTKLSVPCIMSIAHNVFHKTLSIRYHPELHQKTLNYFTQSTRFNKPEIHGVGYAKGFPIIDELDSDWKCESDINKCKELMHG